MRGCVLTLMLATMGDVRMMGLQARALELQVHLYPLILLHELLRLLLLRRLLVVGSRR